MYLLGSWPKVKRFSKFLQVFWANLLFSSLSHRYLSSSYLDNYENLGKDFLKMVTVGEDKAIIIFPMCESKLWINPYCMKSLVKTLYKSFITLDPFLTQSVRLLPSSFPKRDSNFILQSSWTRDVLELKHGRKQRLDVEHKTNPIWSKCLFAKHMPLQSHSGRSCSIFWKKRKTPE